jgi:hypothetical protein
MTSHRACRVVLIVTYVIEKGVDQMVNNVLMSKKQYTGACRFLSPLVADNVQYKEKYLPLCKCSICS